MLVQLSITNRQGVFRRIANLFETERFGDDLVDQLLEIMRTLPLGRVAGHHQNRGLRKILRDLEGKRNAVHAKHHDISDQEIKIICIV